MFIGNDSIKDIRELIGELKKYLELQKEYTKLELTEKLTVIFSAMVLVAILVTLGMIALFYLSFALAYLLEPYVGGLFHSYAIISGLFILLMLAVFFFRKQLIINPMVNFFARVFSRDCK